MDCLIMHGSRMAQMDCDSETAILLKVIAPRANPIKEINLAKKQESDAILGGSGHVGHHSNAGKT